MTPLVRCGFRSLEYEIGGFRATVAEIAKLSFKSKARARVLKPVVPIENEELVPRRLVPYDRCIRPACKLPLPMKEIAVQAILVRRAILCLVLRDKEPDGI